MTETLALVESPAQLLNVLEWAHVHPGEASSLGIAVLQPTDRHSREQVRRLCRFASQARLVWRRYEVRSGAVSRAHTLLRLGRSVSGAQRLVIGDLFSRTVQALLPFSKAREVVVVDDGTATTELVTLLTQGQSLSRWHQGEAPRKSDGKGGSVGRWLSRDTLERFAFFTCMPVSPPPGALVVPNEYRWTREAFGPVRVHGGADLAGSSLVETGIIDRQHYLEAIGWIARSRGAQRYLAHRRESPEKLREIAARTGMEILHPELPMEVMARVEPIGHTVLTFASTIAYTLPIVLQDSPVRVELCEIDDTWITEGTAARSVDFLRKISTLAVDRHGLAKVPPQRSLPPARNA
ncbi:hypothetical protein DEJ50_07205 [Streptomyces venezuelae]|uniref:Uncharacterized protein n=1 Tax=Streptomyces venezuelae TaxID=54571 RepID=A0A5P2D094_STRVZ|nr:hypothetical protein [Streptomyces venezuelae]QES47637.1 hypothetical protein DEJ50_07205 [Streptomyces venezuelae]